MRALVTGANGFLGSCLTRELVQLGWRVRCLVRRPQAATALDGLPIELMYGDVVDSASLRPAAEGCEVVFHLAGIRRAPAREIFFQVNAEGTRKLCEAMRGSTRPGRLVLCSSLAASGPSSPMHPRREEDPLAPRDWYGESKAEAERIACSFAPQLEVAVLRPCRILGPGDRENLFFFRLVRRGWRLSVTGGPRPLSLIDVEDVVALLVLLGTRAEAVGQTFFAADGSATLEELQEMVADALGQKTRRLTLGVPALRTMGALADWASRISGKNLPINRKLVQQLLAPAWTCSGEKAERVWGFKPRRPIVDSVRRSVAWYQERGWI